MSTTDAALALAATRRARRATLAAVARLAAARAWKRLNPASLTQSWDAGIGRDLYLLVSAAQNQAAEGATAYVDAVLRAQGFESEPEADVVAAALAGVASDGRPLPSLLYQAVIGTKANIGQGVGTQEALDAGMRQLQLIVETQVIDAGRVADGVAGNANRRGRGYVRVLTPPSCGRCAILAGRIYTMEKPFPRHPRCDCVHLPVGDRKAGNAYTTDTRSYFNGLSTEQQNRIFTNAGAQAIRDGADIAQVVNARRGMSVAGSWVQRLEGPELPGRTDLRLTHRGRVTSGHFTTEGVTRHGFAGRRLRASAAGRAVAPVRLMPEAIYQLASDRAEILSLLRRYGYIT